MTNLVYDIHSTFQLGFMDLMMNGMHFRLALI